MSDAKSPTASKSVRVVNEGSVAYVDQYDGETFRIEPGSDLILPFDAACLWFGDPRMADLGPRDKWRTEEYTRIAHRMGLAEASPEEFQEARPRVAVFNPSSGERLSMVAEEPFGPPQDVFKSGGSLDEDPRARIAKLEAAMAKLLENQGTGNIDATMAELGITPAAAPTPAPAAAGLPPVDAPATSPVGPRA